MHDAGFDAYMTGLVFATYVKHIQIAQQCNGEEQEKTKKGKKKSVHFSQLQNKAIELDCVVNTCENKVMFNSEQKVYFDLGKDISINTHFNVLQIQTTKESTVNDVAIPLREFADVHVIKQKDGLFWVQFDEFTGSHTIDSVVTDPKVKKLGFQIRRGENAIRFTSNSTNL